MPATGSPAGRRIGFDGLISTLRKGILALCGVLSLAEPAAAADKWSLWTGGLKLRGANMFQRRVYAFDGPDFLGPGPLGPPYTQQDFDQLKAAGANVVQLSHPGLFTENAPYVLDPDVQSNLDALLAKAAQAGLFAIISFRTGPGRSEATFGYFPPGYTNEAVWQSQAAQDAWAAMWQYTAQRYKDNTIVVGYDLMVEPNSNAVLLNEYDPAGFYAQHQGTLYDWNPLHAAISAAIRQVDATTPIVTGALSYSSIRWLDYLVPTGDARTVYAVHYYEPFVYTHQDPPLNLSYPGTFDADGSGLPAAVDKAWLTNSLAPLDTFRAAHPGTPVVVGEFGVKRWEPGAAAYLSDVTAVFEEKAVCHLLWLWSSTWPPQTVVDDFDFRHGPDPANHSEVPTSDLIQAVRADWERNAAGLSLSIDDVVVKEEGAGTTFAVFTVALSAASAQTVTVDYATSDGTATSGSDYTATTGSARFAPGEIHKTVRVEVRGDAVVEGNEVFQVQLANPSAAMLGRAVGQATILDDDPLILSFSASPILIAPGQSSTLSWTAASGSSLTLDGTPVAAPSGSLSVAPVATTTYTLSASHASGVTATRSVTVTVEDAAGGLAAPGITGPGPNQTVGVSGVTLSWTAVPGAQGYGLRLWNAATGQAIFSGSLSGNGSTQTLVSLGNGDYRLAVRACANGYEAANCGAWSTQAFTASLIAPAGAPTVTAPVEGATLTTSTQTFVWSAVSLNPALPTMTYEVVLRDLVSKTTALQINVPHPATSTIFSLGGSSYELKVRACQAACGPFSVPVTFTVNLPAPPQAKPVITSASVSGNSLSVSWRGVAGADLYQIQVIQQGAGPGGGALTVAARQVSTTSVTLPVPTGQANVLVAACNGNGCGPFSDPAVVNPSAPNPAVPNLGTPMAGTVVSGPTVLFAWNRIPGDVGDTTYRLFVQDLSRQATALDVHTKDNFYAAYFKAEGARYDALVIANPGPLQVVGPAVGFNVSGSSSQAPTMVQPAHNSVLTQGNVQLGWSPVPGATLYEYFVAVQGEGDATVRGVTPGLFVQVPLPAKNNQVTVYSGIVRACPAGATCVPGSDSGWGPWSVNAGPGVTNFSVTP